MPRRQMDMPITHVHHGAYTLEGDIEPIIAELRLAPPVLYQCSSTATPLPNTAGAAIPTPTDPDRFCSPQEIQKRLDLTRRWVNELHGIGIRWVIPYTCNVKLGGKHEGRKGIWKFYDHWDDYTFLGIGPRPGADPIEWMARERDGQLHYSYEKRHPGFTSCGWYKYTPCLNNPHFNTYQRANVRTIALAGYDGVFVDNNNINCYCQHCEKLFKVWMSKRHAPDQLRERFGWSSYDEVHLGWRGNRMDWVKYDPLFRRFVEDTLPSQERIQWFETDDMNEIKLQEAGSGWLWGRSNEFLSWVYVHISPEERRKTWGVEHIEDSWGIRDERDRLLWAETSRFWASCICDNLRKIKGYGQEVSGKDFLVVPNWGELLTFQELAFREDMGHDIEEWAPATDIVFWEDNRDPGRTAEGLYFDYSLEYKLAHAAGVRSGAMAALPGDHDTCALAHGEAVAHGGAFIQRGPEFADLRGEYNRFLSGHQHWFEGYVSAARAGLVLSFQTYRLGGHAHIRDTFRLVQFLNDQQVPFDVLVDTQLPDRELLRSYSLLVCSELAALSNEATAAFREFVCGGGILFGCGALGTMDEFGAPRSGFLAGISAANVIRCDRLNDLLPPGQISREDALEFVTNVWRYLNWSVTKWPLIDAGDYAVKIERFVDPRAVATRIPGWQNFQVADPYACNGLRVVPYSRVSGRRCELSIHLLNYNVDLTLPAGKRSTKTMRDIAISLPVGDGLVLRDALCARPGKEVETVDACIKADRVMFNVPELDAYALVHLTLDNHVAH